MTSPPRCQLSTCNFTHATFVLIGIPGLEAAQFWIGFPLLSMYAVALFGNCIVVFIVRMERSLTLPCTSFSACWQPSTWPCPHPPCPRSSASSGSTPGEITFDACMTQMFFIHTLSAIESTILLAMSFDRCSNLPPAAPCRSAQQHSDSPDWPGGCGPWIPLLHPTASAHQTASLLPINVLSHSYCLHQDVMKLAYTDTLPNMVYGLTAILLVMGVDALFISLSYFLIIRTVLQLPSKSERAKAFGTCVSHIGVVLAFYVPSHRPLSGASLWEQPSSHCACSHG